MPAPWRPSTWPARPTSAPRPGRGATGWCGPGRAERGRAGERGTRPGPRACPGAKRRCTAPTASAAASAAPVRVRPTAARRAKPRKRPARPGRRHRHAGQAPSRRPSRPGPLIAPGRPQRITPRGARAILRRSPWTSGPGWHRPRRASAVQRAGRRPGARPSALLGAGPLHGRSWSAATKRAQFASRASAVPSSCSAQFRRRWRSPKGASTKAQWCGFSPSGCA